MTFSTVFSRALSAMEAPLVRVEVHLANGLPAFNLVGLPETEVKESRERVRAAPQNSRLDFPGSRRAPSTWRRLTCRRNPAASICLSRSEYSQPPRRFLNIDCATMSLPESSRCPASCDRFEERWR